MCNGLFPLLDLDSDSDSDSDSKPYAEHVSTYLDSDSVPFPIVSTWYRNLCPSPNPKPNLAMEISRKSAEEFYFLVT